MSGPTVAKINLTALRQNYQLAVELAPQSQTLAVVKANAYGHGAQLVAEALDDLVPALAVARIAEAIELRDGGIQKPLLLLEGPLSAGEVEMAAQQGFWLMASGPEQVARICESRPNQPVKVWLKIDSGMHRLGVTPDQFAACYAALKASANVQDGIVLATHFACADDPASSMTQQQITLFNKLSNSAGEETSLANSAGILHWQEARADWNRAGIMLYGASPFIDGHPNGDRVLPVMSLESEVIALRDVAPGEGVGYSVTWRADRPSKIATVAIGYGDGYPRHAPGGTPVLVNGQRARLAGTVSMDMITVDVTDLDGVSVGDPVELWGENLLLNEIARCANTISYELTTRMPLRVPREVV